MRLIRLSLCALIAFVTACTTLAQPRVETLPVPQLTEGETLLSRAATMRELWVGLPWPGMSAADLLAAMRSVCDDTTTVAVIDVRLREGLAVGGGSDTDNEVLSLARHNALAQLHREVGFRARDTRMVTLGAFESAPWALDLADRDGAEASGVVLIDPPVDELAGMLSDAYAGQIGIDVLLHSRSDAEFRSETRRVREGLGALGQRARVIHGTDRFASFEQRLRRMVREIRGFEFARPVTEWVTTEAADAQVVHVGELHGNPGAHRLQLEVLRAMIARGDKLALSTEQFERDVQPILNAYLAGEITEEEFLRDSRPWPNYADYRPLIELCRQHKIPVLASNIPRRLAARVHREGVEVLEKFSEEERTWSARALNAPEGAYRDKFMRAMGGAQGHNERLASMFAAQCIKDDTMAESIADWLAANPQGRVLHINGAFHSEGGLGVPERLAVLRPGVKQAMLTCREPDHPTAEPVANEWFVRVPASRPAR